MLQQTISEELQAKIKKIEFFPNKKTKKWMPFCIVQGSNTIELINLLTKIEIFEPLRKKRNTLFAPIGLYPEFEN